MAIKSNQIYCFSFKNTEEGCGPTIRCTEPHLSAACLRVMISTNWCIIFQDTPVDSRVIYILIAALLRMITLTDMDGGVTLHSEQIVLI